MRKQYHLWPAGTGFDAWEVERLISLSRGLPVHAVPVDSVREVDTVYWFDGSTAAPTVRAVVEHARLMLAGVALGERAPRQRQPDRRSDRWSVMSLI